MNQRISLLISIEEKDVAKEILSPNGTRILWDNEKEEWYWPEEPLPPELEKFTLPGTGTTQDTVLTLPLSGFQEMSPSLKKQKAGRLRWNLLLQRAIWRGKNTPPRILQEFLPPPQTDEALATILINREKIPTKKKDQKLTITLSPWDQKPKEDEIIISSQGTLPPEKTEWFFPATSTEHFRKPYQDRIPPIRITETPQFSPRSKEALQMLALVRLTPHCTIHLPAGAQTPPIHTLHCLPELERKYKKKFSHDQFLKILQSFGLNVKLEKFQILWNPLPEKDSAYLNALCSP